MLASNHFDVENVHARQAKQEAEDLAGMLKALSKPLQQQAAAKWEAIRLNKEKGLRVANLWLRDYLARFNDVPFAVDLGADDFELRFKAKQRAADLADYQRRVGAAESIEYAAERYAAQVQAEHETGAVLRLTDSAFWLRNMRKSQARTVESELIKFGEVSKSKGAYISNQQLERWKTQKKRNAAMLASTYATNDLGESFTLAELSAVSVSNPEVRTAELLTRCAGLEEIAQQMGDCGLFLTITCPSAYHAQKQTARGWCFENKNYAGLSPRDGQQYLCGVWARIRAALARRGCFPYGIRVAEPHHDGTPHWHLLLFVSKEQRGVLVRICRKYARQQAKHEFGAWRHRFNCKQIDWAKGSAVGYLIKYLCKNIDGKGGEGEELEGGDFDSGLDAPTGAERVGAWASCWGVRQFQFVGTAPVGIWRELRRMRGDVSAEFKAAADCADVGDWAGFACLMKLQNKKIFKVDAGLNKYQEEVKEVKGVLCGATGAIQITRLRTWTVGGKAKEGNAPKWTKAEQIKTRAKTEDNYLLSKDAKRFSGLGVAVAFDLPRTGVNNCTNLPQGEFDAKNAADFLPKIGAKKSGAIHLSDGGINGVIKNGTYSRNEGGGAQNSRTLGGTDEGCNRNRDPRHCS